MEASLYDNIDSIPCWTINCADCGGAMARVLEDPGPQPGYTVTVSTLDVEIAPAGHRETCAAFKNVPSHRRKPLPSTPAPPPSLYD